MIRRHQPAIAASAVLVGAGLLAAADTPYGVERAIGRWVYDWPDALTTPLEIVMQVGTLGAVFVVAAGLVVVGRYRAAAAAGIAGFAAWLIAPVLKDWLERPRPTAASLGRVPREVVDGFAWPSSHAAIAAALATVLLLTVARGRVGRSVAVLAVLLTALARLHLGVHWGLDVVGGMAFGALVGYVATEAVKAR